MARAIPRIYQANLAATEQGHFVLSSHAAHHLVNVLRLQAGDDIIVFDGQNHAFYAKISQSSKKATLAKIDAPLVDADHESPLKVHVLQALAKADKMDFILQKTTELGVDQITPLMTTYSEMRLKSEVLAKRMQHWAKVLESSCEQCQRNRLPLLNAPATIQDALPIIQADLKLLLTPTGAHTWVQVCAQWTVKAPKTIAVLVGPEGGLSHEEEALATQNGFIALQLGPRVLRTETAASAVLAILQAQWGDLQGNAIATS